MPKYRGAEFGKITRDKSLGKVYRNTNLVFQNFVPSGTPVFTSKYPIGFSDNVSYSGTYRAIIQKPAHITLPFNAKQIKTGLILYFTKSFSYSYSDPDLNGDQGTNDLSKVPLGPSYKSPQSVPLNDLEKGYVYDTGWANSPKVSIKLVGDVLYFSTSQTATASGQPKPSGTEFETSNGESTYILFDKIVTY